MSSIDERVVGMKFDNAQFENGIKTTLASLDSLNKSLKMEGATKGLSDLNAAGKNVHLEHISEAVDGIANKFRAMSIIGVTALVTIAHEAVTAGLSMAKSLTIDPVKSGLEEYQTNINAIQTILSNTRWQNTGLVDVNKALNTLNEYSDKTIYNFSQMARNIGTFTAAGVKLDVATNAIKGIANLAAVSGSSAEQASIAMYQLSQAIATGTVKLIDWNSVVNAGMGGKVFQDALLETARNHHVAVDSMIKDAGSFRATLEKGWLTSQILTETLQHFTGDMTAAQLVSMGYTAKQAAAIEAMGKDAQDAATKVKTITQLFSTLRESAGSGWAMTWQLIFGDFEQARDLFTSANDTLGGFVKNSADARNSLIKGWADLGGRTVLIEAISIAFQDLLDILSPIGKAFRDVFPATTAQQLYNATVAIRNMFQAARLGEDTMDNLRRTFAGAFSVLGIFVDIGKQVIRVLFDLFGMTAIGSGGFLEITANVGDFLVALRKAINEGDGLIKFFDGVEKVLALPIKLLSNLGHILASLFSDFDPDAAAHGVTNFIKRLGPLGVLADFIVYAWNKVISLFGNIWHAMEPFASKIVAIVHDVDNAVGGLNFANILDAINTAGLIALVVTIRNSFGKGGLTGIFSELTSTLSSMQTTLKAATLLQIALAVGVLAVSISILSKIDSDALAKALVGISVMFTELLASLAVMSRIPGDSVVKVYVLAAAMTVLAVAIDLLVVAVKVMSTLDWNELAKGLTGVAVLLAAITVAARFLPPSAGLISTGLGLLVLSAGIKVLAGVVTELAGLSWEELARGISAVGVLLGELTLFSRLASADAVGVLGGVGIILVASAIKILASAVLDLAPISWENIGKGMAVLATSLTLITAALVILSDAAPSSPLSAVAIAIVAASLLILAQAIQAISGISWENVGKGMAVLGVSLLLISTALIAISDAAPTAILSAGAILIVAFAVEILAKAIATMGGMSWEEIVKGLVTLGGALAIIVIALNAMLPAVPGAFAMLIVANALLILSGVLKILGGMSWGEIVKGLVALALAFAVIGVAAALLSPVIPAMIGLGVAITLIGLGLALAGAGVFLFAAGLTALSAASALGVAAIVAIVSAVIGLIPVLVEQVGIALLILIDVLIEAIPKIVELVIKLILQLLDGLDKVLPGLAELISKLIVLILIILEQAIPQMVRAGYHILIGVLNGIADNIGKVVVAAGHVIENFLRGIGQALPGIIQSGVDLILAFIRGLTKAIDQNSDAMGKAGGDLAVAIIKGMVKGLSGGIGQVAQAAKDVAKGALHSALNFLGIASPSKEFIKIGRYSAEGMALGLDRYSAEVVKSSRDMGEAAMNSLRESLSGLSDIATGNIDLTPTIRPVLDLTDIQKNASRLDGMLGTGPIDVTASYSAARQASAGYQDNKDITALNEAQSTSGNVYNYTQNNNSPKALSTAEIYRQTNNQLSAAKGGLP